MLKPSFWNQFFLVVLLHGLFAYLSFDRPRQYGGNSSFVLSVQHLKSAEATKQKSEQHAGLPTSLPATLPANFPVPEADISAQTTSFRLPPRTVRYPLLARKMGLEGRVLLNLILDASGKVSQVILKKSSGYTLLDEAAKSDAKNWIYALNLKDQQREIIQQVIFRLL